MASEVEQRLAPLGDREWVRTKELAIKACFPTEFQKSASLDWMKIRFNLKLVGIDYRSDQELAKVLQYLTGIKLIQVRVDTMDNCSMLLRSNPQSIFA